MTRGWRDGRRVRGVVAAGAIAALAAGCGGGGATGGAAGATGQGGAGDVGGSAGAGRGGAGGSAGAAGGTAGSSGAGGSSGRGGSSGGSAASGGSGGGVAVTEVEPNDTAAAANDFAAIAVGGRVTAAIGAAGDADTFSITVPAGATALYVTTFSSGVDTACASANTNATLFAADGTTQLASNNNIAAAQLCSHISYAVTPGTYFVRITANSATATFAYVLAVRAESLPAPTAETEPNDDGTPAIGNGMSTFEGNDFTIAAAGGPFGADAVVTGALDPAGDEDVFALANAGTGPTEVYLETFNGGFGACTGGLDTQLRIRDASGNVLAFDDDAGTGRFCSFLAYVIPAGTTVYAHVIDFGDNTAAPAYSLHISFP